MVPLLVRIHLVLDVEFECCPLLCLQTEAAKPVFGKYYREPKKSAPLPFHLIGELIRSLKRDHFVSDTGDIVYYQSDPEISASSSKSD